MLDFDGKGGGKLSTEGRYANFTLIFDWRWNDKDKLGAPAVCVRGTKTYPLARAEKAREWIRTEVRVQGKRVIILRDSQQEIDDASGGFPERGPFCIASGGPVQIANLFVKEID